MMTEQEMLQMIDSARTIFLLEPPYKRKYVPLGLAKIASYAKQRNKRVSFGRAYQGEECDLVCIGTLFTYDYRVIMDSISRVRFLNRDVEILVGGPAASLLGDKFGGESVFATYSQTLDRCVPDYSIDWQIEEPWDQFSFTFTSRGCPNRCAYCAVHRIERAQWINPDWQDHIVGDKPCAMVSDNNLSSCDESHIGAVIDFLAEKRKQVVFDNGLDCKLITPGMAKQFARLRYTRHGMRLAFDRIEEDGTFQQAVRYLIDAGVSKNNIMAYVLFNFTDTPQEAEYRMRECANLGIRPYPQQYTPLNATSRENPFIGKHWTKTLLRAFRHYWLMAGFYMNMSFGEYIEKREATSTDSLRLSEDDWMRYRTDRLRCLGNAVVPAQAEFALSVLMGGK